MYGNEYIIADMVNCAWYGALVAHNAYKAAEFIGAAPYTHGLRWVEAIEA